MSAVACKLISPAKDLQVKERDGVSEDVVRTVSENANARKFDQAAFEKEEIGGTCTNNTKPPVFWTWK